MREFIEFYVDLNRRFWDLNSELLKYNFGALSIQPWRQGEVITDNPIIDFSTSCQFSSVSIALLKILQQEKCQAFVNFAEHLTNGLTL